MDGRENTGKMLLCHAYYLVSAWKTISFYIFDSTIRTFKSQFQQNIKAKMSDNPYPGIGNEPLLNNQRVPPPPPPAYNNPSFNAPNPSFNNPNPSFNNPNPYSNNPPYNNPNPNYPNNANPYQNNNQYPNNYNPNPTYVNPVGSVGNYQVVRNGPYVQNFAVNVNCPLCRRDTSSITRKATGGVTWIWCFVLFIVTGVCCCIPFCVDSCQDTEIVCVNCQTVKSRIEANCC